MGRVAYNGENWLDLKGTRKDIQFTPILADNHYFHVPEREVILCLFSKYCYFDQCLGEIFDMEGIKVNDIPVFVHPDYKGSVCKYQSKVAWVQEYNQGFISFVVDCNSLPSFRIKLDLTSMKYLKPQFGVR
ncbi:hypothetical protein [uncultured Psychrosphaera sp.]|uniref:hypothetical protein n=1 Tax=uncultured Psychrosphaera sp. TaxID=1403522 RepID=UPI0026342FF9|nr:hypothetical protein [uncultured Psychrosphaera sp.]